MLTVGKNDLEKSGTTFVLEPVNWCAYLLAGLTNVIRNLERDMAKEEKKDDKKAAKADVVPLTPEAEAAAAKKKKLIMFGAIGLLVVGGGAFAAMKILGGSTKPASDAAPAAAEGGAHGDVKKDPHAAPEKDAHGKTGKDAHGESTKDAHAASTKDAHGDAAAGEHAPTSGDPSKYSGIGVMYDLKPFHLNLGNPLENRYVRMEIRLEFPNEEQRPELTARDSQLRDAIVSIISRKTREHLLSPDGKDQLRLEIKNRINQYLDKKISNIYITDILIE
jgi:flagellar FliL protein